MNKCTTSFLLFLHFQDVSQSRLTCPVQTACIKKYLIHFLFALLGSIRSIHREMARKKFVSACRLMDLSSSSASNRVLFWSQSLSILIGGIVRCREYQVDLRLNMLKPSCGFKLFKILRPPPSQQNSSFASHTYPT